MSSAGIPIIRTGDGRLHQHIRRALDEFNEEHGPTWIFDQIDVLIACAAQLLDTIKDERVREHHAALCAMLLRKGVRLRDRV